jgi:hypothetical protein
MRQVLTNWSLTITSLFAFIAHEINTFFETKGRGKGFIDSFEKSPKPEKPLYKIPRLGR